jgi:hypothetical protein
MKPRRHNPKVRSADKAHAKMTAFIQHSVKLIEAGRAAPQGEAEPSAAREVEIRHGGDAARVMEAGRRATRKYRNALRKLAE